MSRHAASHPPVSRRLGADPVQGLRRVALAVAHPGSSDHFAELVRELAASLPAAMVLVAVYTDATRATLRTLAVRIDCCAAENFDFPTDALPAAATRSQGQAYVARGLLPRLPDGSVFAARKLDSLAAVPLFDSDGEPLGLLAALDRRPLAGGDEGHVQAMLGIAAATLGPDIERRRTDEALRAVALAVSASPSGMVFDELVRLLATLLQVEVAFIARYDPAQPGMLRMLAMYFDGEVSQGISYPVAGTPCETVLGQRYRAYPTGVQARFPSDADALTNCLDSYAGHPLAALDGSPLGIVSVASRRPLRQVERVQATLKILAVRVAAEVERLSAAEAQKQVLEDLRQREEQYRAVFEGSLDGLFVWDEQLRIADVNPAGVALYGVRREDVIGRTYPRSMPADYVRARLDQVRGALAGRTTHVETTVLRPDGSTFEADLRVMPFVQRGRPHALTVVRDITERRRADRALRDSEEQYRAIFNASIDAMVLRAADFSIVDVNATYEAMTGYTRAEVLGLDRVLANPPEVSATIRAQHEKALGGAMIRLETQLLHRDGHRYELELRGVPIQHRGRPHVLYIGRDITQARRSEQALRDSEEQYRAIFNASADALVLRDAAYRAVEVNPAYTAASGYTREEVMAADRVLTQADAEVRRRHRIEHDLALASGREMRFEVVGTRKDGSTWQAEVRGTPMTYRGQPHVLYAVRDITERRAAEQRRAELERQLRQSQKMEAIGHLTGGLAHDFNNILTSVLGYVAMAQERPVVAQDSVLARQLEQARLAAERARDHVAQLLAFSRPRRGERRLLAPDQVAEQALQLLRPNLPTSIRVSFEVQGGDAAALPPVVADPVQFEQVLLNLCLNARDAIGEHGSLRLRIGHSPATGHCSSCSGTVAGGGGWVWFEVIDDGRGMAPDVLDRMFEPFFTTKEVGRGTGMGLAMVHGIVHDHGGHVQVESAPGCGSTFRVLLPAARQAVHEATAVPAPVALVPAPPLQGRVLLVEDEPTVGGYMHELMSSWGLEVVLEQDPVPAAQRLASHEEAFALLMTDQTMPGMTGLALARHARQHRPGLPVLLYTGNAGAISPEELADCGVAGLLRKPIDAAALRPLLRDLLGGVATGPSVEGVKPV